MKYYDVNSNWLHKSTGQKINKCFVVLSDNDPIMTILEKVDMSGFTYIDAEIHEVTEPIAVNYYSHFI